jgi:hypothetical protein
LNIAVAYGIVSTACGDKHAVHVLSVVVTESKSLKVNKIIYTTLVSDKFTVHILDVVVTQYSIKTACCSDRITVHEMGVVTPLENKARTFTCIIFTMKIHTIAVTIQ